MYGTDDDEHTEDIMARKLCDICNTRTAYTGSGAGLEEAPRASDLCNFCFTEGGWENTHSDEGHDLDMVDTTDNDCWICHPELNPARKPVRKGHTNTATKSNHSHAGCSHPATPKNRAACRKAHTWNGTAWA